MAHAPFQGCWDRIDRAKTHANALATEWNAFVEKDPYVMFTDVDPEGHGVVGLRRRVEMPADIPLLLGEVLYQLRAALDNCVYTLAVLTTGSDPPPGEQRLQFPIYDTPREWKNNESRLNDLTDDHRRMLKDVQAFNDPRWDREHLALLNRLAREDRHRTLRVVAAILWEADLDVSVRPGSGATITEALVFNLNAVVDDKTPVVGFTVSPPTTSADIDVDGKFECKIEVVEAAAGGGPWRPFPDRIRLMHEAVAQQVGALEAHAVGQHDGLRPGFRTHAALPPQRS